MKKLIVLLLIIFGACTYAQGIKFEESKFADILTKAKNENKLVFIDAYTTWCGPCKLMAKNIFVLQSVGDYYNSNFINVKIDMEKGEGRDIAKKYNVFSFPTYLFLDGNGEVVFRSGSSLTEQKLIQVGKDAQDPTKQLALLKKRFNEGEKDPTFLRNLFIVSVEDQEFSNKIVNRYFKGKKNIEREDLKMFENKMDNTDTPLYKIFKERKAEILKLIPQDRYNMMNEYAINSTLLSKYYDEKTKIINEPLYLSEAEKYYGKEKALTLLQSHKISIALKNNDIPTFEKLSLEFLKNYTEIDGNRLAAFALSFFKEVTNRSSLEKAIQWALESVKKGQNYINTETLANLYNKVGNKNDAKIWAEKSIELAKKEGQDSSEAQKLVDSLK
ncbi:thiol:disulfide interchange protein [Chryseobacterium pennae]|uniref:Thiol:disulfide interchange protein n=1 Tax=Chryseobacterium pennae TaxID=2258962 RepID=A0A3D9C029_9FLAO|nr:thioredoxin fold domain-containing protein [Chryseobacterium pennae]REC59210.1 thiol:disulfide interchange protein [Chryseobacterium pennae]